MAKVSCILLLAMPFLPYTYGVNVARGKPAYANTIARHADRATQAVDGVYGDGSGASYSCYHNNEGSDNSPWWVVDLGHVFTIDYLKILNRYCNGCGDRFRDFYVKVLTSFDPNNPTAHAGEVCKYYTGIFPMRSLTQLTCDNKHSGRYVMISMPRPLVYLNFCEVEVHPVSPPGTNPPDNALSYLVADGSSFSRTIQPIYSFTSFGLIHCMATCMRHDGCVSVSHKELTSQCHLYAQTPFTHMVTEDGSKIFMYEF